LSILNKKESKKMVEIRYGENYEEVDLAGKTVAEVREQFKEQFGIPDKAQVKLGGKGIKQKHEAETRLNAGDKITFAQKSRKGLVFIGALLLALSTTGGVFASGALTDTISATVTAKGSEFCDVTANTAPSWSLWGAWLGAIPAQTEVFHLQPGNTFTGDFVIQIYLTNADQLAEVYRVLGMRWTVTNGAGNSSISVVTPTPTTAFLSLANPVCEIEVSFTGVADGIKTLDVDLDGGFFKTHYYGSGWGGSAAPDIFLKVIQKGT